MGDYKKLRVWQAACEFADRVERMVEELPTAPRRRALDQLVPAAHAIHENIAEGCGFDSDAQLAKYLRQSLATANESEDELLALERRNLIPEVYAALPEDVRRICAMLAVFRRRVEDSLANPSRRPSRRLRAGTDSRRRVPEARRQEPSEEQPPSQAEDPG